MQIVWGVLTFWFVLLFRMHKQGNDKLNDTVQVVSITFNRYSPPILV